MECDGGGEQTGYGGEIAELQCGEKEPTLQKPGVACPRQREQHVQSFSGEKSWTSRRNRKGVNVEGASAKRREQTDE